MLSMGNSAVVGGEPADSVYMSALEECWANQFQPDTSKNPPVSPTSQIQCHLSCEQLMQLSSAESWLIVQLLMVLCVNANVAGNINVKCGPKRVDHTGKGPLKR